MKSSLKINFPDNSVIKSEPRDKEQECSSSASWAILSSLRMPSLFLLLRLISVVGFAQGLNYDEAHHCYQDVLVSNVNFITSTVRLDLVWFNQLHLAKYHFQVGVSPDLMQDSWPQVKKSPQLKIHINAVKIKFKIPEIKFAAENPQKCSENWAKSS